MNFQVKYIYSVKEDSNGHIWIGTDKGLVELDKDLKIVKCYEDTIGEVKYIIYMMIQREIYGFVH